MPLARRLPKFGFTNAPFKTVYEIVNLSQLKDLKGEAGPDLFVQKGWGEKRQARQNPW